MLTDARVGEGRPSRPPPYATGWTVGEPLAIFKFLCRSRCKCHGPEYLSQADRVVVAFQILGVIPRSPSPIPLEDRSLDGLTEEELRQAVLNLRDRLQRPKIEDPDIKPRVALDGGGDRPDKPIEVEGGDSGDDGDIEVVEVVNLAEKCRADMLDISDDNE
jgi:hypothetical protein